MRTYLLCSCLFIVFAFTATASAQTGTDYALDWATTTAGGGVSSGAAADGARYGLETVLGEPVGVAQAGNYALSAGHLALPRATTNLALFYVNADNNLTRYIEEDLLVRILKGARNPAVVTLMVLDGPKAHDAYLYRLGTTPAERSTTLACNLLADHSCNGVFQLGQTVWPFDENITDVDVFSDFVAGQMLTYAADRVMLTLVGHGGGWAPDLRAGQPQGHGGKPADEAGGLLWDDHAFLSAPESERGNSLSTIDLGKALAEVKRKTGRQIDLLYLDACLMAMWEVAYEVRDSVRYLLAAESWSWTSFAYEPHLGQLNNEQSIEAIGQAWIRNEIAEQKSYPYTYSLIDLSKLGAVADAIDGLARALQSVLPAGQGAILTAYRQSDCFDSNGNGEIDLINPVPKKGIDNYCDLNSFAVKLRGQFPEHQLINDTTVAVQSAVDAAVVNLTFSCGVPHGYSTNRWCWQALGGLSIYLPLGADENRRGLYPQLQAANREWDEFLQAYWRQEPPAQSACAEPCQLPNGPLPIFYQIYLPGVVR